MRDRIICEWCGYELRFCPNCNSLDHFVKGIKIYVVNRIVRERKHNHLFAKSLVPLFLFRSKSEALDFIHKYSLTQSCRITWILQDNIDEYIKKGAQFYENR